MLTLTCINIIECTFVSRDMSTGYFIVRLVLYFSMSSVCVGIIQHGYMTNYFFSHRPVEVNDSMILELTSRMLDDRPAKEHLACDVNIVTLPSRRILIHFLSLEISLDEKEVDRLHVYDYKSNGKDVRLTPSQGLYGLFDSYYRGIGGRLDDYTSTGNRLKLDYQGKPTLAYDGFKILITSFRDSRGDCGRGYLRCVRKNICIPVSLWCDGYQNCGNDDDSDEANCSLDLEDDWKPIDGTITAVLASAISSIVFLISLSILAFVVLRISKRQLITTNIIVEYKKRKSPNRQLSNGEMLTRLYAPPSYEVVIGMDEEPPPYHCISGEVDTESDDEYNGILREQTIHDTGNSPTVSQEIETHEVIQNGRCRPDMNSRGGNSTVVSCDVHGCDITEAETDLDCEPGDSNNPSDFLSQSKYRLCSSAQPDGALKKMASVRGYVNDPDIEVLSDDSDSSKDSNRNNRNKCNGNLTVHEQDGAKVNEAKANGHVTVTYQRSPSKRDSNSIEFADSD